MTVALDFDVHPSRRGDACHGACLQITPLRCAALQRAPLRVAAKRLALRKPKGQVKFALDLPLGY